MRLAVIAVGLLALGLCLFAQSDRGVITGTVLDPAAAVVPGAKVAARNLATGAVHETVTTETGNFTLASLPAGKYELTVEARGFKLAAFREVQVQVAQVTRIDAKLEVGAVTESVVVSAAAPLL
ncbi:MAG: carboxypeptidase-like regulatory domain-containing protein, partial [Bryobacterales bacterium]|nr:carboxypeptidase-like regulatory domain-containing protein [Bryobacterales bacterium]